MRFGSVVLLIIGVLAICAARPASADQFLGIGDPVPSIEIGHFFQGEPLKSFDKDKTYVLEFWATWCGPCLASMPHLRDLSKKYEGKVNFIALSDEPVETVAAFLDKPSGKGGETWRQVMAFPVATDPDLSVKQGIFQASGQDGIPCSVLISKGQIQWIGHPMSLDKPLEQVVGGTWDLAKAKKEFADEAEVKKMLAGFKPIAGDAMSSGDWTKAIAYLDDCAAKKPDNDQIAMTKWNILLLYAQKDAEAYAYGEKLLEKVWDDAQSLNQIAWTVVDDENVKTRNLAFAQKAAERANELTGSKDGAILDTLARVHFEAGRIDEAIRLQKQAVENSTGEMADDLRKALEKYEAAKAKKSGEKESGKGSM